jgi:hypothetical protein
VDIGVDISVDVGVDINTDISVDIYCVVFLFNIELYKQGWGSSVKWQDNPNCTAFNNKKSGAFSNISVLIFVTHL